MFRRGFISLQESLTHWRPVPVSRFDVCVIGAGPAGIAAALRAADYNKRVCLIESHRIGGCDLWNGTLQSKTLWEMSNFLAKANGGAACRVYGAPIAHCMALDEARLQQTLRAVSETREAQLTAALRAAKVELLFGRAVFTSSTALEVHHRPSREYRVVTADYFIIATGSKPREHPFVRPDGRRVVTSDAMLTLPIPSSLVIVGGGVLGTEFAAIFARLGRTRVFLLDAAPRIMPKEDEDVSGHIQRSLSAHGAAVHSGAVLYDLQAWDGGVQYTVMHRRDRRLETFHVERALLAVGRVPNDGGLGLDRARCAVRNGRLVLDAFGRCAGHAHIYAVGDAAGDSKLVIVAESKGRGVVDRLFAVGAAEAPARAFSRLMFLTSAVASVGMNETQCRQQNVAYVMAKYSLALCSRAVAANHTDGFVKILASQDACRTLLGVRVVGLNASTIIELATAAIQRGQSAYELSELLTAYPSVSQAFLECLRVILGRSTLKPGTFPGLVRETWTPPNYTRGRGYVRSDAEKQFLAQQHMHSQRTRGADGGRERRATANEKEITETVAKMSTVELLETRQMAEAVLSQSSTETETIKTKETTNVVMEEETKPGGFFQAGHPADHWET